MVNPLHPSDCNLFGLRCVPAMAAVFAVTTPDDIKFALDYFLGQDDLAVSVQAVWALWNDVDAFWH